jgi:hypothetical protein
MNEPEQSPDFPHGASCDCDECAPYLEDCERPTGAAIGRAAVADVDKPESYRAARARESWRAYASAALQGFLAQTLSTRSSVDYAAEAADQMLELERERFGP